MSDKQNFYLRMPFLHPAFAGKRLDQACFFKVCPEACGMDANFWQPSDLPLQAETAAAFLRELDGADAASLENMRLLLQASSGHAVRRNEMRELADLGSFRKNGSYAPPGASGKTDPEKLHFFLLWLWALEEKLLDLAPLEERCGLLDARLLETLLEDSEDWFRPEQKKVFADPSFLPDWRLVLSHMLPFAPVDVPLLAEGEMRSEFLAAGDWRPLSEVAPEFCDGKENFLARRAAAAEMCGSASAFVADAHMIASRLWLVLEDE